MLDLGTPVLVLVFVLVFVLLLLLRGKKLGLFRVVFPRILSAGHDGGNGTSVRLCNLGKFGGRSVQRTCGSNLVVHVRDGLVVRLKCIGGRRGMPLALRVVVVRGHGGELLLRH